MKIPTGSNAHATYKGKHFPRMGQLRDYANLSADGRNVVPGTKVQTTPLSASSRLQSRNQPK